MKNTLKCIALTAGLVSASLLIAADKPGAPSDPLAGAFFPPELIVQAHGQIGMSQEQMEAFHARVNKAQPQFEDFRQKLMHETAALAALVKQERVDEATLLAQLDKVLDAEREVKHVQMGLLAAIKNLLTPEQQARLREMMKGGGAKQSEDMRQRLTAKVERVQAGVRKWAESGRDPSEIAKTMQEKFKPLMDAGKVIEAEAELDRVLETLK